MAGYNLPPGVTGNEWQIAGPTARPGWQVIDVEHECPEEEFEEGFTGTVEADLETTVSYGTLYETYRWTCPRCGRDGETERELERSDFEDPDVDR